MLLGFIISEHGIEANLEKILAIIRMGPIQNIKGVQRVTGCLAAVSRFISRLNQQGLPLFTPKFGKLILEWKRLADDVKSKKVS